MLAPNRQRCRRWESTNLEEAKLVRCLVRTDDERLHVAYVDIAACDGQC